jgi:hypothetical protein
VQGNVIFVGAKEGSRLDPKSLEVPRTTAHRQLDLG